MKEQQRRPCQNEQKIRALNQVQIEAFSSVIMTSFLIGSHFFVCSSVTT